MLADSPDFFLRKTEIWRTSDWGGAVHPFFYFREDVPEATLRALIAHT